MPENLVQDALGYQVSSAVPAKVLLPVNFDLDGDWPGGEADRLFFDENKKRAFRLRRSFPGEFGPERRMVLVVKFAAEGFRMRLGLAMREIQSEEAGSDRWTSERLAEHIENP